VIVGGGFGGGCCALQLRRLNPSIDVTLIDANPRYVTCPMSDAVLVDLRTLQSITSERAGLERAGVRVVRGAVTRVDARRRRVRLRGDGLIAYDRLVLAPGIRFLFGKPEGYDPAATLRMPHAWQAGPQTELLAAQLHSMRDGDTLAISVPPGLMRCPPGPYERASLIAHWLKQRRARNKVLIFDSNNHFPRQDVFASAWEKLYPGMIEWIPPTEGGALTRVDVNTGTLYSSSGAHQVAVANVIPPQAPAQLAVDAGLASGHGWCPVRLPSFESQLADAIHVIGDACIGGAMGKTASAASSQARHCAAAIAAFFAGREPAQADFDSVCYSLLGPEVAFVTRSRFKPENGEIERVDGDASESRDRQATVEHAREAQEWYAEIRAGCFGD
jgi:NADPH-dependent 2,4-dienoyl-CoA reductase/sulfur reductase-like enzyme